MLRADADTARARIERARAGTIACAADGDCTVGDSDVAWTTRIEADGDTSYSVEGFAAYDDALRIALESVRQRRVAPGVLKAATISVGDNDGLDRKSTRLNSSP